MIKILVLTLVNAIVFISCLPGAVLGLIALFRVKKTQENVLRRILNNLNVSVEGFENEPLTKYEDYSDDLINFQQTGVNPPTKEEVLYLSPTSGSSGVHKYVPYTKGFKNAFQHGIDLWIFLLYLRFPELFFKRQFWLITPKGSSSGQDIGGVVPVGFDEDGEYLGWFQQKLLDIVWVRIPSNEGEDLGGYLKRVGAQLRKEKHLGLLSVWSPSMLFQIAQEMDSKNWDGVISCWGSGYAKEEVKKLRVLFSGSKIQPKGLLSTEAFLTVPVGTSKHVLSYRSHYFEFYDEELGVLCQESLLSPDKDYELVVTTQSGFVRYRTGDKIRINGKLGPVNSYEFIGRNRTSDLRGEKIQEDFVDSVVSLVLRENEVAVDFWFVAAQIPSDLSEPSYVLYIKPENNIDCGFMSDQIEQKFLENFHYNVCRQNGQLKGFLVTSIYSDYPELEFVCVTAEKQGCKVGDVKITRLSTFSGWDEVFSPQAE
jgi:hypothetical protein